jgi:hypothetical protein
MSIFFLSPDIIMLLTYRGEESKDVQLDPDTKQDKGP